MGKREEAGKYLRKAAAAHDSVIKTAASARLCQHENRLSEASRLLESADADKGPTVLATMLYEISYARKEWDVALKAAMTMRQRMPEAWQDKVYEVVRQRLSGAQSLSEVNDFWRDKIASADKKKVPFLSCYIAALYYWNSEQEASKTLVDAAKNHPRALPLLRLVALHGDKSLCERALRENEGEPHTDPERVAVLADLADRLQLSGQANRYRQMILSLKKTF